MPCVISAHQDAERSKISGYEFMRREDGDRLMQQNELAHFAITLLSCGKVLNFKLLVMWPVLLVGKNSDSVPVN